MKITSKLVLSVAVLFAIGIKSEAQTKSNKKPNIIVVLTDD